MTRNPALGLWLSGANFVLGHARNRATAEMYRQSAIMTSEITRQMVRFWTGALIAQPPRKKKR